MKFLGSVLSKVLGAIAGLFSLAFFTRAAGQAAGGSEPGQKPAIAGNREQRTADPYDLSLPQHGEPMRPGWGRPDPEVVARPTYWPMVFGLGIAFFMWGLISNLFVLGLGLFLLIVGLVGWILDLVGEFSGQEG